MLNIIYSPRWFYGKDILIDIVSLIVLLLIGYFSFQYHCLDKKRKGYSLFAISFLVLAVSFIFKIITNFSLYNEVTQTKQIGFLIFTFQTVHYTDTLYNIGHTLFYMFMLLGVYLLYSLYYKNQNKSTIFFMIFFILITTYFCHTAYYVFHFTTLFFLIFIIIKLYYNCKKTKDCTSKSVLLSFSIIALSQVVFIFNEINPIMYVTAECIQLLGYLLLLISFILVLYYGKKKNQG